MSVVAISFSALTAHVRTARLLATAIARHSGVAEELLDEVRFAVGEACARAVDLHAKHVPDQPVRMEITEAPGRLQVDVIDVAPAGEDVTEAPIGSGVFDPDAIAAPVPRQPERDDGPLEFLPAGFGIAVIQGLVDDVDVEVSDSAGTRVRMSWAVPGMTSAAAQPPPT
jgi:anti-sigma regulatory factor (Ser/Thr protein kinase)